MVDFGGKKLGLVDFDRKKLVLVDFGHAFGRLRTKKHGLASPVEFSCSTPNTPMDPAPEWAKHMAQIVQLRHALLGAAANTASGPRGPGASGRPLPRQVPILASPLPWVANAQIRHSS